MPGVNKAKAKRILKSDIKGRLILKIATTLLAVFMLLYLYKRGVIAPIFVNGEPVTFSEIAKIVRDEGAGNLIDKAIAKKIIEIEAKRRNIIVKQEEIDSEIKRIDKVAEESGKTLGELLKESKTTRQNLEEDIKTRVTLYKILGENVNVTESEIDYYIDKDPDFYGEDSEAVREEVKMLLLEQKTSRVYDSWIKDAKAASEVDYLLRIK